MLSFNHSFTIQYRAPSPKKKKKTLKATSGQTPTLFGFCSFQSRSQMYGMHLLLDIIILQLSGELPDKNDNNHVSHFPCNPQPDKRCLYWGYNSALTESNLSATPLLPVYFTSSQTALLRAQQMRSETLLMIGWVGCSLPAEVLGFSLVGTFCSMCCWSSVKKDRRRRNLRLKP